jgi:hypothetical protein
MDKILKCVVICGAFAMGVVGILLMVKVACHRHHTGMCEKVGKGIDEVLTDTKKTLDKTTGLVQGA